MGAVLPPTAGTARGATIAPEMSCDAFEQRLAQEIAKRGDAATRSRTVYRDGT
jgi:hypothetical protein